MHLMSHCPSNVFKYNINMFQSALLTITHHFGSMLLVSFPEEWNKIKKKKKKMNTKN